MPKDYPANLFLLITIPVIYNYFFFFEYQIAVMNKIEKKVILNIFTLSLKISDND